MSRTVVVTGGAGGIGTAIARRLLEEPGTEVAVVDRDGASPPALAGRGERWEFFACDVADPESVAATASAIVRSRAPIAGLVNGAGNVRNEPSATMGLDVLHDIFAVHVDGTLLWSQAVHPQLVAQGGGSIVNVGSVAGLFGHPRRLAYAAAKAAIHSMTRTLAVEWASDGIRVNAVTPGYVATPMMVEVARIGLVDSDTAASWAAMKRLGTPEEVADAAAYLLSERSSFVTGSLLTVDGGFSALKAE